MSIIIELDSQTAVWQQEHLRIKVLFFQNTKCLIVLELSVAKPKFCCQVGSDLDIGGLQLQLSVARDNRDA